MDDLHRSGSGIVFDNSERGVCTISPYSLVNEQQGRCGRKKLAAILRHVFLLVLENEPYCLEVRRPYRQSPTTGLKLVRPAVRLGPGASQESRRVLQAWRCASSQSKANGLHHQAQ